MADLSLASVRRLAEHLHALTQSLTPPLLSDSQIATGILEHPETHLSVLAEVGIVTPPQTTELLAEWVATRANARGQFDNHHPIHGDGRNAASTETPWGCNTCGIGWPCLVVRSLPYL